MGKHDMTAEEPDVGIYEREIGERQHIIEQCPIDIYCSSINPRWGYPYKLMSYYESRPSVRDSAENLIIDSGYRKYGDIDEILEAVEKLDADWFIPPDVTPWFDDYDEISPAERVEDLWEHGWKATLAGVDAEMLVPLHRPVDEHLEELKHFRPERSIGDQEEYNLLKEFGGVAVGLKGIPDSERIEVLGTINREIPVGTHVHGLSPGTEMEMMSFLRENPHMVDSIDVSTPESAAANNKIPDNEWYQHKVPFPTGTDISTLRAMRTLEIALRLNFMLSDLCDDSEFDEIRSEWNEDDGEPRNGGEGVAAPPVDD